MRQHPRPMGEPLGCGPSPRTDTPAGLARSQRAPDFECQASVNSTLWVFYPNGRFQPNVTKVTTARDLRHGCGMVPNGAPETRVTGALLRLIRDICHVVFTPFSFVTYVTLTPNLWV